MFSVTPRAAVIPTVVLADDSAGSRVEVAPARGGMVTRFFAQGREWLFLDEATFEDRSRNVRGGIPVLFPSPGKLEGDAWARAGKRGAMKQHGFARTSAWTVVSTGSDTAASVTLALTDSEATRAVYPWPFRVELTYALRGDALDLGIVVANTGREPMPFGFGFHPYFAVPQTEKAGTSLDSRATRAWDNAAGREVRFERIELTGEEVDLHLEDLGRSDCALSGPFGRLVLRGSPAFSQWVIWTLAGRDFVCVEPWTARGNALNTGERLIELPAGGSMALELALVVEAAP